MFQLHIAVVMFLFPVWNTFPLLSLLSQPPPKNTDSMGNFRGILLFYPDPAQIAVAGKFSHPLETGEKLC